jgi:S-adenosylmethionine-diacylglycerol 3-amino-3-carboxypropyl transferase
MTVDATIPATNALVLDAVGPQARFTRRGLQDRLFAKLFSKLVYAQIWEDPVVDMEAMALQPHHHVVCIASGGCNALSYVTGGAGKVTAVDLNAAHVALVKLKVAGLKYLPDWQRFYTFFGAADDAGNVALYNRYLAPHLDRTTRDYWESNGRLKGFTKNIYKRGLLGKFIALGHFVARLHGVRAADIMDCETLPEQRKFFDTKFAPLLQKRWIKAALRSPIALFGLGIPPAQYEALSGGRPMDRVIHERLEKLSCGFALEDNYFARQAFARSYAHDGSGSLPPYLQEKNFSALKAAAANIDVKQANLIQLLAAQKPGTVDRVSLLDAQDWMTDAQLNDLWQAITNAAAPGARVIFRTAGHETILPGRVGDALLGRWTYLQNLSQDLNARDRSSIYGGFHVYELRG